MTMREIVEGLPDQVLPSGVPGHMSDFDQGKDAKPRESEKWMPQPVNNRGKRHK
jgi:hypothetical protein